MKSIWSGTISFGLVQIPVQLFSAIQAYPYGFHVLHDVCNTRLSYERWCPHCKEKVEWQDAVKGLPASDDKYYVFTQEKLEELKPERTDSIDILYFADRHAIPDIYFDAHFYIVPERKGLKPFFLFLEALDQTGLVAIGKFVMRDKEYICAIEPYEEGLLLTTLNYEYEIRPMERIAALKKAPKLEKNELTLAIQLIDKMTKKKFDISKFKDTFIEKLKKALKSKKPTKTKPSKVKRTRAQEKARKPKKREDLITTLRTSLQTPARERVPAYARAKRAVPRKSRKGKA